MTKRKKIAQILYSGLGGTGNVFFSIVEGDREKQVDHCALFYGIEPVISEYREKCHAFNISYESIVKNRGLDLRALRGLYSYLSQEQPDAIILHNPILVWVCFIYGLFHSCKTIVVEHQTNQAKTLSNWIGSTLSLLFASRVVLLTDLYYEEYRSKYKFLLPKKKLSVINNGIRISENATPKVINRNEIRIGMASRLNALRDHKTIINALALMEQEGNNSNYHLLIAGDGSTLEELKNYSYNITADVNITFLGMLNEAELEDFFKNLDIYVHSSLGETMSISIMQAMAFQLPIIATDIPGINNMIKDGETGLLFNTSDHQQLKQKIERLVEDHEQRIKLASQAYLFAKSNYSQARMFNAYFNLINNK